MTEIDFQPTECWFYFQSNCAGNGWNHTSHTLTLAYFHSMQIKSATMMERWCVGHMCHMMDRGGGRTDGGGRRSKRRPHLSLICHPSTVHQTHSQLSGSARTAWSHFRRRTEDNHTTCRGDIYSFGLIFNSHLSSLINNFTDYYTVPLLIVTLLIWLPCLGHIVLNTCVYKRQTRSVSVREYCNPD